MAKDNRSEYVVDIGGIEHTFLLTEDDAARYPKARKSPGAAKRIAAEASQAIASAGKAADQEDGEKAADTPANKAATPAANKS